MVVIAGYFLWHMYLRRPVTVRCADGSHSTIEHVRFHKEILDILRETGSQVADKAKLSTGLDAKMLQQPSEAVKETREFSKLVAAGYNSCGITKSRYERYEIHAYAADNLAQKIDSLLSRQSIPQDGKAELATLINRYSDMVRRLATD